MKNILLALILAFAFVSAAEGGTKAGYPRTTF